MKKALFLSLLMVLVGGTILSACGTSTSTPAPTVTVTAPAVTAPAPTVTVTTPAPSPPPAKPVEITVVGDEPLDHAMSVGALKFIKLVEERSQGRITGKYFPAGQLMTRDKWIEALSAGTGVGFGWYTLSLYTRYDTRFLLPSLPYAIVSIEEFLAFTRSDLAKEMAKGLEKNQLQAIAYFCTVGAILAKKPLRTPDDYKGLKIRVSKSPTEEAMWKRMGASTLSIPFSEVPTAVQQGTVDAVASGPISWPPLVDLLKYGQDRPAAWSPWLVVTNKAWWDKLPADLRGIMEGAMRETADDFNATAVADSLNSIKAAEAKGGTWVKLSSEEQKKMKDIAVSVWPDFEADIGKDFLDRFRQKGW